MADGAEVLGMAGGDGSQADVAAVAVAHDLPFVCIPAGTRNHFALDLNLDRNDPRLALDAFVEGVERRVDHGLAGGKFFVNNVSLGIYPHVVDDPEYREGRMKAAASIIPQLMDPGTPRRSACSSTRRPAPTTTPPRCCWSRTTPTGASRRSTAAAGGVSLDGATLGVLVIAAADAVELSAAPGRPPGARPDRRTSRASTRGPARSIRVDSDDATVLAGIDGEAMEMPAPLDITIVPKGLRVIVPVGTPDVPEPTPAMFSRESITNLVQIAGGVSPDPYEDDG